MASKDFRIKLLRLANVHYQHPDLSKANQFLLDFGLEIVEQTDSKIYYRTYGTEPYCYIAEQSSTGKRAFCGGAFVVASSTELEKATKIPGAGPILEAEGPGGGKTVTIKDPNGMTIKLLHGQQEVDRSDQPDRNRHKTRQLRFNHRPSKVHKLGHYGFLVPPSKFLLTRSWYLQHFNLKITDSAHNPEKGGDQVNFMYIDLGETYSDPNGMFLAIKAGTSDVVQIHHSSFEVYDMNTQVLGHQWLEDHGWTHCWSVSRSPGNQMFDYWFDGSGFILEHYSNDNLANFKPRIGREKVGLR